MAESFLSLREDYVLSSAVGGVSYLVRGGNTGRLAPFQTFLGNFNTYELWDETHICQGASLLWASREDEWPVRRSAGLWFPFCVRFGRAPKWQARTTYQGRVWSHAFPMLSHTKQWGLPQLTRPPFQLSPPVHVLALCRRTKPPFWSPRFLHMGIHYQMRTLRSSFFCLFVCLLSSFYLLSFPDSSVQWVCRRQRICAHTALCPVVSWL